MQMGNRISPSICCWASSARATHRARSAHASRRVGDDVRSALNDLVGQSPVYAGRNPFDPNGNTSDAC